MKERDAARKPGGRARTRVLESPALRECETENVRGEDNIITIDLEGALAPQVEDRGIRYQVVQSINYPRAPKYDVESVNPKHEITFFFMQRTSDLASRRLP